MTNDDQNLPKLFISKDFKDLPIGLGYVRNKHKGTCDLFGQNQIIIHVYSWPNRWIRFWSKVFFNSKWTINKEDS